MSQFSRREVLKQGAVSLLTPSLLGLTSRVAWAEEPKKVAPKVDPYIDAVFVDREPPKLGKGSFTVVVLPDTQHYSEKYPENYLAQTSWIVDQKKDRNIACVLHLGDITNHSQTFEWENAQKAMNQLDEQLPYFMVVGNHDCGEGGDCSSRATRYSDYFPLDKFRGRPEFGGVYDKEPTRHENSYHLFSAGGRDFVVISLEYGPRNDVLRWAGEVADKHANRAAILTTHAYMYYDETRYDWSKYGKAQTWNPHSYKLTANTDVNDGEEIWQKLIRPRKNFVLTLNGHVLNDGLARIATPDTAGRDVHQVLVNFQMKPKGGDGWLRLLEFKPDGTVDVCDYSPTRKQCNASAQNQFTMKLAGLA